MFYQLLAPEQEPQLNSTFMATESYDVYELNMSDKNVWVPAGTKQYIPQEGGQVVGFVLPDGSIVRPIITWEKEIGGESEIFSDLNETQMQREHNITVGEDLNREFTFHETRTV